MFHEHERFDSMTKVTVTLNAILAGDEILDFIIALMTYGPIGLLYAMAFCILFIICIHNVFIYVVGEAFKDEQSRQDKLVKKYTKRRATIADPIGISQTVINKILGKNNMTFHLEGTVVASQVYEKELVVQGEDNINFVKKNVFNKIIPQSRDKHIIEMNLKKGLIKDDIHYLKESFQNLVAENIGRPGI